MITVNPLQGQAIGTWFGYVDIKVTGNDSRFGYGCRVDTHTRTTHGDSLGDIYRKKST